MPHIKPTYNSLLNAIGTTLQEARNHALKAINTKLVKANWAIGKHIVEFEQHGKEKAEYRSALLTKLSKDLKQKYGKGFSKSNIYVCRQFYLKYPKFQTVSGKLSWSHYAEILSISNDVSRSFYETQCILENWSYRELKRQIASSLFERLAISKNKNVTPNYYKCITTIGIRSLNNTFSNYKTKSFYSFIN